MLLSTGDKLGSHLVAASRSQVVAATGGRCHGPTESFRVPKLESAVVDVSETQKFVLGES